MTIAENRSYAILENLFDALYKNSKISRPHQGLEISLVR